MTLQGGLKVVRKNKTIFKVECDVKTDKDFDEQDYKVHISKGTTGEEMAYAIAALLNVVIAHEECAGNKFSINSFMNYLKMIIENSKIGVPQK
jgi:hypothetical protein